MSILETDRGEWRVDIRFLYYKDCPSHEEALERLRKAIREEGVACDVTVINVETTEQAERLHFVGSPTIIIDGHDIAAADNTQAHYALTCRAYTLEDGRISPLPSIAMIRRALRAASGKRP
jgi:hypothetical protein